MFQDDHQNIQSMTDSLAKYAKKNLALNYHLSCMNTILDDEMLANYSLKDTAIRWDFKSADFCVISVEILCLLNVGKLKRKVNNLILYSAQRCGLLYLSRRERVFYQQWKWSGEQSYSLPWDILLMTRIWPMRWTYGIGNCFISVFPFDWENSPSA